ncbi:class I SAM-dependent methyltransferase [Streptococcus pacificus]|uniref:Class I SAM-dependent methyltransferase n=1 Tax=Streptococcus pacificus TaxID=2740577 RepID=A0ABS0ZK92_9STRE|nr:class I SAM-dependent methyltransferase [Streptococcus pacificus]MBJ8326376.1 class I SAM-dependent methyltransferase [Streptococcus pacificus]
MNFETIEQAFHLIWENTQVLANQLKTSLYDALIEQNGYYLEGSEKIASVKENNAKLHHLSLTKEEWRKTFEYLFIKMNQYEKLQTNHQFTPDAIGFLILFLMETVTADKPLTVIEMGSGTGNLAQTIATNSEKKLTYLGIELDDLLIDLAASISEIIDSSVSFFQADAVRPHILKESDVIISDLPVGYYPNDAIASRYLVAAKEGHTYAHHLMMEQAIKYLKDDGIAIFLAPFDLLTSEQSTFLKHWLVDAVDLLAVLTLPENLFGSKANAKSLFLMKKKSQKTIETFAYPISDLQDKENLIEFMENFKKWVKDHYN